MKYARLHGCTGWLSIGLFLLVGCFTKTSWGAGAAGSLPIFGTLGGALALESTDPARYNSASVKLVAFGYTRCQHACPMILAKYAQVQQQVKAEPKFVSVFVSFDAEHDDSSQLSRYLEKFDERIVGMSGHAQKVKAAMKQFGATYRAIHETEDYDHTQRIYLLDDQNQVRALFEPNTPTEQIIAKVNRLL